MLLNKLRENCKLRIDSFIPHSYVHTDFPHSCGKDTLQHLENKARKQENILQDRCILRGLKIQKVKAHFAKTLRAGLPFRNNQKGRSCCCVDAEYDYVPFSGSSSVSSSHHHFHSTAQPTLAPSPVLGQQFVGVPL